VAPDGCLLMLKAPSIGLVGAFKVADISINRLRTPLSAA